MIPKTLKLSLLALAILGWTCKPSTAQTPTVIQIDIENYAYYYADNPDYKQTRRHRAGGATGIDEDFLQLHRTGGHRRSERHTRQRNLVDPGDHHKLYSDPAARAGCRGHHAQLLRGLGMGNPAGGRNAGRHDHGYGNGLRPSSARFARWTVSDRGQHYGDNRRNGGVPGNARASRLLADYRDGTRCLGSRGSFDAKSFGRRDAQLPAHSDPSRAAGDPQQQLGSTGAACQRLLAGNFCQSGAPR